MPEKDVLERVRKDKRDEKSASTQAGEFVREEIEHIREGKHGARSANQAKAIGLSKARRAGVKLPRPPMSASKETREQAERDERRAKAGNGKSLLSARVLRWTRKDDGRSAASNTALSRHARGAAAKRSAAARSRSAKKAAATRKE